MNNLAKKYFDNLELFFCGEPHDDQFLAMIEDGICQEDVLCFRNKKLSLLNYWRAVSQSSNTENDYEFCPEISKKCRKI